MTRTAVAAAILCWLVAAPAVAQSLRDPEAVKRDLASSLGVDVLHMEQIEIGDEPVYLATVMQRGGDSNSAFMVSKVGVDARSGQLLPPIRLEEAGYALPSAGPWLSGYASDGRNIRRRTFQE